jgi:hypothetical protein
MAMSNTEDNLTLLTLEQLCRQRTRPERKIVKDTADFAKITKEIQARLSQHPTKGD